eukprot:1172184-Prorocentrum_minimum.AAC.1
MSFNLGLWLGFLFRSPIVALVAIDTKGEYYPIFVANKIPVRCGTGPGGGPLEGAIVVIVGVEVPKRLQSGHQLAVIFWVGLVPV